MNPEPLPYLIDRQPPDSNHTIPYQVVKATSVYRIRREKMVGSSKVGYVVRRGVFCGGVCGGGFAGGDDV